MWAMKMNFTRSHQMIPHVQISPSSLPPDPLLKHSQESSTGLSRGSSTFAIYSQPYLDSYNECYFNLVTLSTFPAGPISSYVRKISFPPLSEFQTFSSACTTRKQCGWALRKINGPEVDVGMGGSSCCRGDLMTVNEVPQLFEFLMSHEYKIDTSLTKMMNTSPVSLKGNAGNSGDLIAFVTFLSKESKFCMQPLITMDKDSNDLHSYLPASFSSLNEKEQSLLLEYVQSMDDLQKKALTIAKEHLKSSFQLQKSNGYSEWLKEREKRG